jgi:hypothetical protein
MRRAWHALAAYSVLAILATWPLARGLGRDVAGDLGDPVLNIWIIAWDCEQLLGILRGDFSRIATFFDANIFHPAPLSLAYSEHLIPQALQALPLYAVSRNPILAYNVVFLLTFVLSGLGMYLFVRELTGKPLAAFVAGLLFAFAPYRFPQTPHIQVVSSQWMPFVLYGFRRYFFAIESGGRGSFPLTGAVGALILQNLSCGYYLLYFSPFATAYAVWEMARRGFLRRRKVWGHLTAAALVVAVATAPFLLPYAAVRELGFVRARSEVIRYSADVYSYGTAASTFWTRYLQAFPKPEGDLFPGVVPVVLAALGLAIAWRTVRRRPDERRRWLTLLLGAAALLHVGAALVGLLYRRVLIDVGLFDVQISNISQMIVRAAILAAMLMFVSPTARDRARVLAHQHAYFALALLAAMWLSLGPLPLALGRPVEVAAPYAFLYENVPGFEGVRVPARFAMVAVLMLATLAGFGAAALSLKRFGPAALALLAVGAVAESVILPFPVNVGGSIAGYNAPDPRLQRPARAPDVYKEIARLPADAVIAELPLGLTEFDLRAMYYSLAHGRRLLNGYSGFLPPHYGPLQVALSDVARQPDAALTALQANGATHVVVHERTYLLDRGPSTTAALVARGATQLYRNADDVLLRLP